MRERVTRGLPGIEDAIEWLALVWDERDVPLRLHDRGHEGWGPPFAPAFARRLDATPDDTVHVTETRDCRHLRLVEPELHRCPDCAGEGFYETQVLVYRYPTWRAMTRLYARHGRSWNVVVSFVISGYSRASWAAYGASEAVLLRAIRRMFDCYERAPAARVSWLDKSQAQQMAEVGA